MRIGSTCIVALAVAACDAEPSRPIDDDAAPSTAVPLGMNDVTVLVPRPASPTVPALVGIGGDPIPLVSRDLADQILFGPRDIAPKNGLPLAYGDFHVVAVRFDLCARDRVGACHAGEDGRLRVVLQPFYQTGDGVLAHDVALHAFYPIPSADLPAFVAELRALALLRPAGASARLAVSPSLADPAIGPAYAERLRALIRPYTRIENLVRLTVFGQSASSAAFAWIFRGLDRRGGGFAPIEIPGLGGVPKQHVLAAGGDAIYDLAPVTDAPAGFATAINGATFGAATAEERRAALSALVEVQDPTRHDAVDLQCASCHVATHLATRRAASLGVDLTEVEGRYTSTYDVTVDTIASTDPRVLRGLGWAASFPAISQRAANDTAQVLTELEARFPSPP